MKDVEGNLKYPLILICACVIYIWLIHIRVGYMWEKKPLQERPFWRSGIASFPIPYKNLTPLSFFCSHTRCRI